MRVTVYGLGSPFRPIEHFHTLMQTIIASCLSIVFGTFITFICGKSVK